VFKKLISLFQQSPQKVPPSLDRQGDSAKKIKTPPQDIIERYFIF